MRHCKHCNDTFPVDSDHWIKEGYTTKAGEKKVTLRCKTKRNETSLASHNRNKDERLAKNREYQAANKEAILQQKKQYYRDNRDTIKQKRNDYYVENTEKCLESAKLARDKKKDYHQTRGMKSDEYRKLFDINFKLSKNLRTRFYIAVRAQLAGKTSSAVQDLGCTMPEFMSYMETLFTEGMTWDNYGDWHIDHIKPLCSYNLSDPEESTKACHYTNLQPLWAVDNLQKNSTY